MAHDLTFGQIVRPTGHEQDSKVRLYGDDISQTQFALSTCRNCAQRSTHQAYITPYYRATGNIDGDPCDIAVHNSIPPAEWFWAVQGYLQILHNLAVGIPTINWVYNAGAGNNFMQEIACFDVFTASSDDNSITLYRAPYGDNPDPRACTPDSLMENPEWPLSGARYISAGDGNGSLQPFDYMTFEGSALAARGVKTFAVGFDYNHELISGVYPTFKVFTLSNPFCACVPVDGAVCRVHFWRRRYSPPLWTEVPAWYPFYGFRRIDVFEMAAILDLKPADPELGRVIHPSRWKIEVGELNSQDAFVSSSDISDQLVEEHRILITSGDTGFMQVYLGDTNALGDSVEDLTSLGTHIRFTGYEYDPQKENENSYIIGPAGCKYGFQTCGMSGSGGSGQWSDGVFQNYYCSKKNDIDLDKFGPFDRAVCFDAHCPYWAAVEKTLGAKELVDFFNHTMFAQDIYMLQTIAGQYGNNDYKLYTRQHPSVFQLLGHYKPESPVTMLERKINIYQGLYGWDLSIEEGGAVTVTQCSGGVWNEDYDFNNLDYDTGKQFLEAEIPAEAYGKLNVDPSMASEFPRKKRYNWSENNDLLLDDVLPSFCPSGYSQDTLTVYGSDSSPEESRGGEIDAEVFITANAARSTASNDMARIEFGEWDSNLSHVVGGGFGAKITLKNYLDQGVHDNIVEGRIHRAERLDANTVRVHCELAAKMLCRYVDDEMEVTTYMGGGNVVELPDWLKDNNRFAFNRFGSNALARSGHGFYVPINGVGRKWTIKNAYPCSGDSLSYVPQQIDYPSPFMVPRNTLDDAPFAITSMHPSGGNQKMYLTVLAYCATCDAAHDGAEQKWRLNWEKTQDYPFSYSITNWQCQKCGATLPYTQSYPDDMVDLEVTGIPPGQWTRENGYSEERSLEMELESDEYSLRPILDEDGEIESWQIFWSGWVLDALDASLGYKVRLYYTGGDANGVEYVVTSNFLDMEIPKSHWDVLSAEGGYIKVYDSSGELITMQPTTLSAPDCYDIRLWWDDTSEDFPDGRYRYCPTTYGGKYYLRFHFDLGGTFGSALWIIAIPPDITSEDYYNRNVAGRSSLHGSHYKYACKADILDIVDHGQITDPDDLAGLAFSVANNSVIHDSSEVEVYAAEKGTDLWSEVVSGTGFVVFHALGVILISQDVLDNYSGKAVCFKIT